MSIATGAVKLPPSHLSARIPWHDTDWTGRVCERPASNHSCGVLKRIKDEKDSDLEQQQAGVAWPEITEARHPPCVLERAGFMRPKAHTIIREHPYAGGWTDSHTHFAKTPFRMPAYSIEAIPFRWVMRDQVGAISEEWGIEYDRDLEDKADEWIKTSKPTNWVQDHRNQLALLDSFFSSLVPERSLVFLYAKDVPLLEDRRPGARILVGVGRITEEVAPAEEWSYSKNGPLRSVFWERGVAHSIRPKFEDGFLLPYQELISQGSLQGMELEDLVAIAPADHFAEFSYVTERVGDDGAIAALMELARVVDLLSGVVEGPWDRAAEWLGDRLSETWDARGAYPGLGSALAGAGIARGPIIAQRLRDSIQDPAADPWPHLEAALGGATGPSGPAKGLMGRSSRKAWQRIKGSQERYSLLRLLSRFALTSPQARRLFDPTQRSVADAGIIENPYLLYELDRGEKDEVGFSTVDRGLFPRSAAARKSLSADPMPEPVDEPGDDRRVRAACVQMLEGAADQGHTLLDEPTLRRRLAAARHDPPCDPTTDLFEIAVEDFAPTLVEHVTADGDGRAWQLQRLAQVSTLIAAEAGKRIEAGPLDVNADWRGAIDRAIDQPIPPEGSAHDLEVAAREEKAVALEVLSRSRVAALVGPAGTGKTMMLKALCADPKLAGNVLLLAPTGKSRVQLGDKVVTDAQTLAQFLRRAERWSWDRGYYLNPDGMRFGGYDTVIVDEASMLTEEMLGALIEALKEPKRIVLCGDHRQLPPIGAGRPFADLLTRLGELDADAPSGGGVAELRIGRRQAMAGGGSLERSDLAVAAGFASGPVPPGADQALARVVAGEGDGTLTVASWKDESDLHEKLVEVLCADPELGLGDRDPAALRRSLGAVEREKGQPWFERARGGQEVERWQILSPVRARDGGIAGLNELVRDTWRPGNSAVFRRDPRLPSPMGADQILEGDKVLCAQNHPRSAWGVLDEEKGDGYLANGEIGAVCGSPRKRDALWVEFATQPGLRFTFWEEELNSRAEFARELLELAYAMTIHKAQGSQFERTFVVVPNPCPLLSPELLYTALTRHRGNCVLLAQGDPMELLALADPARSETARRLTCLFRPPDPFAAADGGILDGSHVHRSANGEPMRSKSEIIVANILRAHGVDYSYEELLRMEDGSVREPDFTVQRPDGPPIYWEHLGMLDLPGYRADWEAKRAWYEQHDIRPRDAGGGPAGTLVWSIEGAGGRIDAKEIERLASELFGGSDL